MGILGYVSVMFQEKGEIVIEKGDLDEEVMMMVLDDSAEDFSEIREARKSRVRFLETAKKFQNILNLLEDDGDLQELFHNAEFPEGWEG